MRFALTSRQGLPEPPDVGGECAVYMIAQGLQNARKNRLFPGFAEAQNLDAPPLSPYTSAVP
jgi:hypothetical protein